MRLKEPAERIAELSSRFGLAADPAVRVEDLSVGLRQRGRDPQEHSIEGAHPRAGRATPT